MKTHKIIHLAVSVAFLALAMAAQFHVQAGDEPKPEWCAIILQKLATNCPTIRPEGHTGRIALLCDSPGSNSALKEKLTDKFKDEKGDFGWLHYKDNKAGLDQAISEIADAICPKVGPQENEALLAGIIAQYLTNCPGLYASNVCYWNFDIAWQCQDATNRESLKTRLTEVFDQEALRCLKRKTTPEAFENAARQIAIARFPDDTLPNSPKHDKLAKLDPYPDRWGQVSIWSGAKFSNPYTINGTTKTLETAGSSSDAYIEINLSSRYVLRQGDEAGDPVGTIGTKTLGDGTIHFIDPIAHMPDVDGRIGYLFRGSGAPTNYSAATIVGTSDFYADGSVGLPILRYCSKDYKWKEQVSLELNGGFATDKEHLTIHPNAFLGLGWQSSFILATNRQGYWISRVGCALIDQPAFVDGTRSVQFDGMQVPVFDEKFVPATGLIVVYPLTDSISLQAGINAYFTDDPPASWNATLGATMNLDVISKFCSSILEATGNK